MKIGLVLSGGVAKAAYQIGALEAIGELIPKEDIKYISGASVGALNGYAYAVDYLSGAREMWENLCNESTRYNVGKILRGNALQLMIKDLYKNRKPLECKLYATLLELKSRSLLYTDFSKVEEKDLLRHLRASVALPVYNKGVVIDGKSYYDGALIDCVPVYPLLKHNVDYIICLNCFDDMSYRFENTYFDNKIIKISFPTKSLLRQTFTFRKDSIEEMLDKGYSKTMFMLKSYFAEGYDNLDYIYNAIEVTNRENGGFRLTKDVAVANFNKITGMLTKRKILK